MRIYFFGDSICFGQYISPQNTWVVRIAQQLETLPEGDTIMVNNPSISGDTTRMALERMAFAVQAHHVDILVVQFGINDCNLWATDGGLARVSKRAFEANFHEIIVRARAFGAKRVFLNTNHPTRKTILIKGDKVSHQQGNAEYNRVIRRVAKAYPQVQLIDMEKAFARAIKRGAVLKDLLLQDGIHLSVQGHQLYYSVVYPFLEKAVLSL